MPAPAQFPDPGFLSLFEQLPIGAYRSLPDGRMLRANPALVRMSGFASEAALLAEVSDLDRQWYVAPGRRAEFVRLLGRDGELRSFVSEIRRQDSGEHRWVSENAHMVRDAAGQPLYYEGTVEDITDRVQAESALRASQSQVQEIADQLPGVVYRSRIGTDGSRRYLYMSGGLRELMGLAPSDALHDGAAIRARWHPEDRARVMAAADEHRAQGRMMAIEHRLLLPDGEVKWVHVSSKPVRVTPEATEYVGVVLDVTAQKRAEAQLRENNERWKLALESTGDGVWDWNLQTGEEVYSERFLQMYGYDTRDLASDPRILDRLTHPDDVAAMQQARLAHFEGRTASYVNEHRVRCQDGRWKWVLSRGLVIERDAAGQPLRMIGTHTDITARKQAEELQLERDRAETANRAKTQLLSRVSHELRTPLNAVLGFAQLLDGDASLSSQQRGFARHILQAGRHLLGLVDDVLDLSSAQGGQLPMHLEPLAAAEVFEEAWLLVAASGAAPASLPLQRRFAPALPPVRADRRRLVQVLVNLLTNALKYNRPGGQVEAALALDGRQGQIVFSVSDEGQGLTPEQLARLFSPFERLGAQRSGIAGTGLGLALSLQLAQAMGGQLQAGSQPGLGAVFTLRLPVATGA